MSQRTIQVSISGGEVSPFMYGRIDDDKNRSGAAKLRNMIASPQGPAENRTGFSFVREVKFSDKETRIIPFTYSTTQTMNIEIGEGYFRFHTLGATLLSGTPAAYNGATAYVKGDMVTSGGNKYYCIAPTTGNIPPNVTYWYLMPSTGEYEIPTTYLAADVMDIHYVQSNDVLTLVHPLYPVLELRRYGATNWQTVLVSFVPTLNAPGSVLATATVAVGPTTTYSYKVSTVGDNGIEESYPSASSSCVNNLLTTGNYNTITWAAATGAKRYNVYKQQNGLYGYIGQTDGLTFKDDNITANLGKTPLEAYTPFTGAGNYPGAVTYYEQRRAFGGTINQSQSVWLTRSGTESNLSYSIPSRDDDGISFKVAARESNTIRHLVPINDLIALTSAAEWKITSSNGSVLTPSDIDVKAQSYIGANNAQPVIVNNNILYAAARGGHIVELAYDWRSSGYVTNDASIRSAHLFDNLTILDIAYSKSPRKVCWFVSSNGKLLGFTYDPGQLISAWHQHDTDGQFRSISVTAEGDEDYLYAVIKRTINGVQKRYIERMTSRNYSTQADAMFMDSSATYYKTGTYVLAGSNMMLTIANHGFVTGNSYRFWFSNPIYGELFTGMSHQVTVVTPDTFTIVVGTPGAESGTVTQLVKTLSGLTWLEGKEVALLTDGAVHPRRTVTAGSITLDNWTSKVQVGLPYQSDFQSLPLAMQIDNAYGMGKMKNINKVIARVYNSSGIFVGYDENNLIEYKQRTTESYGSPPAAVTGNIDVTIPGNWNTDGQVFIRQNDPLPLTIVSLTLDIAVGG